VADIGDEFEGIEEDVEEDERLRQVKRPVTKVFNPFCFLLKLCVGVAGSTVHIPWVQCTD
jgi:hypothetical protein